VTHSIAGPPAMRQGPSAASIAWLTAWVEFGLMTMIRSLIEPRVTIALAIYLPALGRARNSLIALSSFGEVSDGRATRASGGPDAGRVSRAPGAARHYRPSRV
jgi:hypothetical protein